MDESVLKFEVIFKEYYKDVYHFAIFYTNSKSEAEDITQETFVKAHTNLTKLKDPKKLKSWILAIAKNTAVDYLRKKKKITYIPFYNQYEVSSEPTPEEYMVTKDDWEIVQIALLKLKPQYRSLIIFRGIKEFTTQETAEILGLSEVKVRVGYHRAMKRLKQEIGLMEEGQVLLDEQK